MKRFWPAVVLLLVACLPPSTPEPDPLSLAPPAPPAPQAGEIRIFGHQLPVERAREIRARLRKLEPRIVAAFEGVLAEDPYAGGTTQLRFGINPQGKVTELKPLVSELNNNLIGQRVGGVLRDARFAAGPEAWVFYTMTFQPDPFEVLTVEPQFDRDPPTLATRVLNRSAFRLSEVAITVRVQGPEKAAPLRISQRRIRAEFEPGGSRTLMVPLADEWASDRYSFLVDVRPAIGDDPE